LKKKELARIRHTILVTGWTITTQKIDCPPEDDNIVDENNSDVESEESVAEKDSNDEGTLF